MTGHGTAYVYVLTACEYKSSDGWMHEESDGLVYDEGIPMERTLTIYRNSKVSNIEYMLDSKGDWEEFWHISYGYPGDCTYFEDVENGTVTLSGDQALWENEYSDYREIYVLSSVDEY